MNGKVRIWGNRSSKGEKGDENKIYEKSQKNELINLKLQNKRIENNDFMMCARIMKHTR